MQNKYIKVLFAILILISATTFGQTLGSKTFRFGSEIESVSAVPAGSSTPAGNSVNSIMYIGDTIWVGTSRGLSRSTDKGVSWKNYYGTSAFGSESIAAVNYDSYNHTIWVSTAHSTYTNGSNLPEGTGLRYSRDNGETWVSIPQSLDNNSDTVVIYGINRLKALPVTVAIQNITYDIANTPDAVFTASFAGGLRKSTDYGQTWQRVVLPPDFLNSVKPTDTLSFCMQPVSGKFCSENNLNYRVFSVIATDANTIYVGTANGINKSTDGGISWKKMNHQNQDKAISGNFVVGMNYNSANNSLWAATWKAEDLSEDYGVSVTTDGGVTWKVVLDGEKIHNFGSYSNQVVACSDNGPYKTTDMGNSWLLPGTIKDNTSQLYLKTDVFLSACYNPSGTELWLGSNDGLIKNNTFGLAWPNDWKIYFASQPLGSVNDCYAYPNPFNPKTDNLKIKYSTNGKTETVTIKIFDFGMNYIRTVVDGASRGTVHALPTVNGEVAGVLDYWDGKDDNGKIVPNGVYFYRIQVGSDTKLYGKIIVLQ